MSVKSFNSVLKSLAPSFSKKLKTIPVEIMDKIIEIRLRVNQPVALVTIDDTYFFTENGCLTNTILSQNMVTVNTFQIAEIFNYLCNYSVYSKENEIKNGFITIEGGHRVGLCGTAVIDNDSITNIYNISSLNIRIACEHKNSAMALLSRFDNLNNGLLICGSVCSGKTTILRDMARLLSTKYNKKVALIDPRSELSATYKGVPQFDVGLSDVLNSYTKEQGFQHAIRTMSPDIIICDEIYSESDMQALENAVNSGVAVICSCHCSNIGELKSKRNFKNILDSKVFSNIAFLGNKKNIGIIENLVSVNDVIS